MLYQSCWNNLVTGLIVPSSLLQFVNSLFQTCSNKFGTSSANTSCQQLVNRLVTTCIQVCSNLCVFTCVLLNCTDITKSVLKCMYIPIMRHTCIIIQFLSIKFVFRGRAVTDINQGPVLVTLLHKKN